MSTSWSCISNTHTFIQQVNFSTLHSILFAFFWSLTHMDVESFGIVAIKNKSIHFPFTFFLLVVLCFVCCSVVIHLFCFFIPYSSKGSTDTMDTTFNACLLFSGVNVSFCCCFMCIFVLFYSHPFLVSFTKIVSGFFSSSCRWMSQVFCMREFLFYGHSLAKNHYLSCGCLGRANYTTMLQRTLYNTHFM